MPIGIDDLIRARTTHHFALAQVLAIAAVPTLLAAVFSHFLVKGKQSTFLHRAALTSMFIVLNLFFGALCLIVGSSVAGIIGATDTSSWLLYGCTVSAIAAFDMLFSRWLTASESKEAD